MKSFRLALAILIGAAVAAAPSARAQNAALEYAVKAAFLYKLAPFVAWPEEATAASSESFSLCVVGDDPFGAVLDRIVSGQEVNGAPIVVRRYASLGKGSDCRILFAAGSRHQSVREIVAATAGEPILTVTDDDSAPLGVVHLAERRGKVRLLIDTREATRRRLVLSSKLLSLASVERK